jgi:tungstate transport system ATP-binding protein
MKLVLKVSDLWKEYRSIPVLRGCSFSFERHGIYVLTGPNGSGKSTFLRICAFLEDPDRGEVSYFSDDSAVPCGLDLRRRMTLLLPRIGIFNTSVFKNAAYGLRIRGLERNKIEEKVDRILGFVGLHHKKKQNALTLSSGEAQRLGLARAMVIEPEILFLDEPTASVDQGNRQIIEDIILNMKKTGTSTVVITTHDVKQAERLADRLLVMDEGKISEM